ncbi:MAG: GlmU family protein [Bacteroidota bacterium]
MQLILFDDRSCDNLLPLTFTRPVADLRVGILTIAEKWERYLNTTSSFLTREYLAGKYPLLAGEDNLLVNGSILPDKTVTQLLKGLDTGGALKKGDTLLGARMGRSGAENFIEEEWMAVAEEYTGEVSLVDYPWKIFKLNGQEIEADFELVTRGRTSEPLSDTVRVIGKGRVFVEPGFKGEYFTINTSSGSFYLGRDSEIMEGSLIRGPFVLGEASVVKLSAKIYGPTTIGPFSKVGGEINNSVIHSQSNKGHDGYLGNAVIGQWCNLGADTNNSNLKNNYSEVKAWNYPKRQFIKTGLQFCGLIMGDHSKCGINTMFNTGTMVGVAANIFGSGYQKNHIPSFSWGGATGMITNNIEKVFETASLVMERRDIELTTQDRAILQYIYDFSEQFRK